MVRAGGRGSYPRNASTPGQARNRGVDRPRSQFAIVDALVPMRWAASSCNSPRSSRRLRMWSPILFSSVGYPAGSGFLADNRRWQKGSRGIPCGRACIGEAAVVGTAAGEVLGRKQAGRAVRAARAADASAEFEFAALDAADPFFVPVRGARGAELGGAAVVCGWWRAGCRGHGGHCGPLWSEWDVRVA